jgi:Leucine-rich repeat (LRR) protein
LAAKQLFLRVNFLRHKNFFCVEFKTIKEQLILVIQRQFYFSSFFKCGSGEIVTYKCFSTQCQYLYFVSLLLAVILTIDPSSQSIYLACRTDKKDATCSSAYYIQKESSEIILTPNVARDKILDVYVRASTAAPKHKINLTTFPNELLVLFPKMKGVSISNYLINSIMFDDAMWQIDNLVFNFNNITSFKSTLTKKNAEISFITIGDNPLKTIDSDSFANMFDMRGLYLSRNKISMIHPEAFKDMPLLRNILLNDNQLTSLSAESIKSMSSSVLNLELQRNQIEKLSEGVFEKFNKLSDLNLAQNKLTSFDATLLKLSTVRVLYLNYNSIQSLNLQSVKNLYILYAAFNSLTAFNASEIGITDCARIDAYNNQLVSLNLTGVENLEYIYMGNNNLTTISEDMFPENFVPEKVEFDENQIKSIEKSFITTIGKQFTIAFQNNPCAKLIKPEDPESISLNSCFRAFDKEKAMKTLTFIEE